MLNKLAMHLINYFATDQIYHIRQQVDGTYRKAPGVVNKCLIDSMLNEKGSIAIYQKNMDNSIN